MSAGTPNKAGIPLIDHLPSDRRDEIILIGREARSRFGYAFQEVFDHHLALFDYLAGRGATAVMIGRMLREVGIARQDGTPLPAGTVSSALSRARERAARPGAPVHAPAVCGMDMQVPARAGNDLHAPADRRREAGLPAPPSGRPASPPPAPSHFPEIRPSPNSPATTQVPAVTRRSAELLERLRSKQDDD
ncbi:hypothetical protein [Bradyrhizobium genosp. P]|uniref:hypothetical protein n=1 Tax=Bradyrhizobium genosp. P TaxID=83641 RepID=UPI003CF1E8F0